MKIKDPKLQRLSVHYHCSVLYLREKSRYALYFTQSYIFVPNLLERNILNWTAHKYAAFWFQSVIRSVIPKEAGCTRTCTITAPKCSVHVQRNEDSLWKRHTDRLLTWGEFQLDSLCGLRLKTGSCPCSLHRVFLSTITFPWISRLGQAVWQPGLAASGTKHNMCFTWKCGGSTFVTCEGWTCLFETTGSNFDSKQQFNEKLYFHFSSTCFGGGWGETRWVWKDLSLGLWTFLPWTCWGIAFQDY